MAGPATCYLGLGSNLGNPAQQLARAVRALAGLPDTTLARVSRCYRNQPLGDPEQPWYVNAVAEITTALAPLELLDALQAVEAAQGRVRTQRWGPRTIDIDILLYDRLELGTPRLTLPHPGIAGRRFVLQPLCELAPGLVLPGMGAVQELLRRAPPWQMEPGTQCIDPATLLDAAGEEL